MVTGVIGAGALGLAAALELAEAGRKVVVIEREPHLGGLASGFKLGPSYLERFYHHLFRTDTTIVDLIGRLGLAERLIWGNPDTSVLHGGRVYSLDSPGDVLRFSPLPPPDRVRMGLALAYLKLQRDYRALDGVTTVDWLKRWMGPRAYEVVWQPLLKAKFGEAYERIAMPWFWARVHYRTSSLGYVRGGFHLLYEAMRREIEARGGRVQLGCEVNAIGVEPDGVSVQTAAGAQSFEQVVVTAPTRVFLRLAQGLPTEYVARYERTGEHLGAHCAVLALGNRLMDGVYWLNVNDPGFPFVALVEHTNFLPSEDYGGSHVVYLGSYLPMDHELFRLGDEETLQRFLPHLRKVQPAFRDEWVREAFVFRAPYAQPIVTLGYQQLLPPHATPLDGVFLANMAHIYPQDRGQNYSVALGQRMARQMLEAGQGQSEAGPG